MDGRIHLIATISKISDLEEYSGHVEYDCESLLFYSGVKNFPEIGEIATFNLNNSTKFCNGVKNI